DGPGLLFQAMEFEDPQLLRRAVTALTEVPHREAGQLCELDRTGLIIRHQVAFDIGITQHDHVGPRSLGSAKPPGIEGEFELALRPEGNVPGLRDVPLRPPREPEVRDPAPGQLRVAHELARGTAPVTGQPIPEPAVVELPETSRNLEDAEAGRDDQRGEDRPEGCLATPPAGPDQVKGPQAQVSHEEAGAEGPTGPGDLLFLESLRQPGCP